MHSQTPPPQSEYELFVKEWTPKLSNLCNKYCPQSVPKIPKLLTKYNTRTMMIGMLHQKFFDKYKVTEDDQKILYFKSDEPSNQLTFPASPIIWGTTMTTSSAYWKQQTLVYMKISKNGTPLGQIIIHLRDDVAPLTCENFLGLVTHKKGYGYNGSEFHRVVLGFMIQGGDYELNNGRGGQSIWGGSFKDENFDLQHERGALSMANSGPNTQSSQFFICQSRSGAKHLDNKHVVFGYVVDGMEIVTTINQGPTDDGSRPKDRIVIDDCGVYHEDFEVQVPHV
jgi:cyclophilin family peptidyl-prolyl cis-trans isomerase